MRYSRSSSTKTRPSFRNARRILFVTGNRGKFRETAAVVEGLVMKPMADLPEIQSWSVVEVAKAKALDAAARTGLPNDVLIEDTGLYLKALGGFPGPFVKFFTASMSLRRIAGIAIALRDTRAHATTAFALYSPVTKLLRVFQATVHGTICLPRGRHGFGWDPIFVPSGSTLTFAEMKSVQEKSRFSMRERALAKLVKTVACQ